MEEECDTLPQWLTMPPPNTKGQAAGSIPAAPSVIEPGADDFLTLFTEEEIGTPSPAARRAASVINPLARFANARERADFVRQRIKQLGFDSFSYAAVHTTAHYRTMFVLASYESPAWLTHYFRERYFDLDPRVANASPTGLPYLWTIANLRAAPPRSQARGNRLPGLLDMLDKSGRKSGILIRMPLPGQEPGACLYFNSEVDGVRWMSDTLVAETLMFAHTIHEFIWAHAKSAIGIVPPKRPGVALSELQHAVLQAVVQGLRDKEIAYFLGLSPHNVDYHLRRLRQLFNVRNRVQLINVARTYPL